MIAKLITHGADREAARQAMMAALAGTRIEGIRHNVDFLGHVLDHIDFRAGEVDTGFVMREIAHLIGQDAAPRHTAPAAVAGVQS